MGAMNRPETEETDYNYLDNETLDARVEFWSWDESGFKPRYNTIDDAMWARRHKVMLDEENLTLYGFGRVQVSLEKVEAASSILEGLVENLDDEYALHDAEPPPNLASSTPLELLERVRRWLVANYEPVWCEPVVVVQFQGGEWEE